MKRRMTALLLAVVMTLSMCGYAFAEDETEQEPAAIEEPAADPVDTEGTPADDLAEPVVTPAEIKPIYAVCSAWAEGELLAAQRSKLLPDVFAAADMRGWVTRREFAAIAAKLYESMTGIPAQPASPNTFGDTDDTDVLRCYAVGIVNGMGNGEFRPNVPISRQDAAAMLVRAYKAAYWPGWTLEGDAYYTHEMLDFGDLPVYLDHYKIEDHAYEAVYFLTKRNVVHGDGDGKFAPTRYCTREEAMAMSYRFAMTGK